MLHTDKHRDRNKEIKTRIEESIRAIWYSVQRSCFRKT
jgi:hypothetical protein